MTDLFHYVLGIRIFNLFLGKAMRPPLHSIFTICFQITGHSCCLPQGGADLCVAPHLARSCLNDIATSVLQVRQHLKQTPHLWCRCGACFIAERLVAAALRS